MKTNKEHSYSAIIQWTGNQGEGTVELGEFSGPLRTYVFRSDRSRGVIHHAPVNFMPGRQSLRYTQSFVIMLRWTHVPL